MNRGPRKQPLVAFALIGRDYLLHNPVDVVEAHRDDLGNDRCSHPAVVRARCDLLDTGGDEQSVSNAISACEGDDRDLPLCQASRVLVCGGGWGWWLLVITAISELLIGFWAAGSWNLSVVVLVAWVGAAALMRGVTEIAFAFQLRDAARRTSG